MKFPFPLLLCDIGGTNARFASVSAPGAPLEIGLHLKTKDYQDFETALASALAGVQAKPRSLIVCAAGPVSGRSIKLTNAAWTIDGPKVAASAALEQGLLLNDFEAQAFSLPVLQSAWILPIGTGYEKRPGVELIMGLGTGLGAAALVELENRHFVLSSEAGHMNFGPLGAQDAPLWRHLETIAEGAVVAETILSGAGLMRLHKARCAAAGKVPAESDEIALVETAHLHKDSEEAQTLRLCWTLAARFAGDLALAFLAKGGVTFSGGILPKIVDFLEPETFRSVFENKPPYAELMRGIGTRLVTTDDAVLAGMAAIAAAPQNYAIDYSERAWR